MYCQPAQSVASSPQVVGCGRLQGLCVFLSGSVCLCMSLSVSENDSVQHHILWTGNTRNGQNWLAFRMQVSCRRVWITMHSGVGGQMGSAQIWSTIHQQLWVPDLPPDVSLTDWASCPQQVTLVMMRPVVSTAQSMNVFVCLYSMSVCVSRSGTVLHLTCTSRCMSTCMSCWQSHSEWSHFLHYSAAQ